MLLVTRKQMNPHQKYSYPVLLASSCGINKTSNSISTVLLSLLLLPGDCSGARIDVSVKELSGSTASTIKVKRLSSSGVAITSYL